MKKVFTIVFLTGLIMTTAAQGNSTVKDLLPVPQSVEVLEGKFRLTPDFKMSVEGNGGQRAAEGATRALRRLSERTALFLEQDVLRPGEHVEDATMTILCREAGDVKFGMDESYVLTVSPTSVHLKAKTSIGALRGLETMLQLIDADAEGYFLPAVRIEDSPRFPWRGLMIDPARHWMPVDMVKRNIDGMAAVKMNTLHLHLSEDQGFRIESKTYPKLHELGSDGKYFTQAQIRDIIKYADARGIRVYPEFDVPGHATAWFVGYPELASAPGPYTIERRWGIMDPAMNPANERVYEFLDTLFTEMAALFPDEYFHIGGDENNGKHWDANEEIQAFKEKMDLKDNHELQLYFNTRILEILERNNKKMVGWDEIFQPGMPEDVVIHSWRGHEAMQEAARKGYQTILSNGYYIDLVQPARYHYLNDPLPPENDLEPEEEKFILGGEAPMWAELVTNETVDSRIWPRTAAIAERLWSDVSVRDVDDMYRRLEIISWQLEEHELNHIKNYDMMLRRMTRNNDITALKIFTDVVEPLEGYARHSKGVTYLQHSPYTRVVDAARPESMTAYKFGKLVEAYIDTRDLRVMQQLKAMLETWQLNHAALLKTIAIVPSLKEIEQHSLNLSNLAFAGIEALEFMNDGKTAPPPMVLEWRQALEAAKQTHGQTEIAIVPAVEQLINASEKGK